MAKKIEQWTDNEGGACSNELDALCVDLWVAGRASTPDPETPELNADVTAAIDALHEYAHRDDETGVVRNASGDIVGRVRAHRAVDTDTALPEGVPPELNDWVKRWEWITARVTEDAVRELRKGDQVRIGTNWIQVVSVNLGSVVVDIEGLDDSYTCLTYSEAARIANEVRYNGR
jgi:hypothetical protein